MEQDSMIQKYVTLQKCCSVSSQLSESRWKWYVSGCQLCTVNIDLSRCVFIFCLLFTTNFSCWHLILWAWPWPCAVTNKLSLLYIKAMKCVFSKVGRRIWQIGSQGYGSWLYLRCPIWLQEFPPLDLSFHLCHPISKLQGLGDIKRKEILEVYHQLCFSHPCSVPPWDNWWLNSTLNWSSYSPSSGCCSVRLSWAGGCFQGLRGPDLYMLLLRDLRVWSKLWLIIDCFLECS